MLKLTIEFSSILSVEVLATTNLFYEASSHVIKEEIVTHATSHLIIRRVY